MAKAKKINFELIEDLQSEPYQVMFRMRAHHPHLEEAHIAVAWRKRLKPDADGLLVLGKCVKASDLQRELVDYDFVILLNREVWDDPEFTTDKKEALVDHELCHAAVATDKDGARRRDTRGRTVWRTRKHDIEEFHAIIRRHGCYKHDLERFAEAMMQKRKAPLFDEAESGSEIAAGRVQ